MTADRIDYSDIPPLRETFWEKAVRLPVLLGADIIAWLQQQGKGYKTRLNTLVRNAMLKEIKKSA